MQGSKPIGYQRMMSRQTVKKSVGMVAQEMSGNPKELYTFSNITIGASAASTGGLLGSSPNIGPTLSQAINNITSSGTYDISWIRNTSFLDVTRTGIILWTVPVTGLYRIEIWGARGGIATLITYQGGFGARMRGDFSLGVGQQIKILVGQMGGGSYAGGGGGTFVATDTNIPLIVAGGGNSTSAWSSGISNALVTQSGAGGSDGTAGGVNGMGGASNSNAVAGGAGFYGNGMNSTCGSSVAPLSFINGGIGGSTCNAIGGFGGGSGSDGCCQGASGAGGGYSGGGGTSTAGHYGGAGGSYNIGLNQSNDYGGTGAATTYGGKCIITKL